MALRNQPYLPLYVQDYLTDEKLNMCSASTQGVYIKIMCLFHKSDQYGGILLKQKDKQNESTPLNFAIKLAKLLPFDLPTIEMAINELLDEKVLHIDGDFLYQKRMVRDNELSIKRANSGRKGGKRTQSKNKDFALDFAKAKNEASTENENENVIDIEYVEKEEAIFEKFCKKYQGTKRGSKTEYKNFKKKHKDWKDIVGILEPNYDRQCRERKKLKEAGQFVPQWKNLQTYINNRSWEEEFAYDNVETIKFQSLYD